MLYYYKMHSICVASTRKRKLWSLNFLVLLTTSTIQKNEQLRSYFSYALEQFNVQTSSQTTKQPNVRFQSKQPSTQKKILDPIAKNFSPNAGKKNLTDKLNREFPFFLNTQAKKKFLDQQQKRKNFQTRKLRKKKFKLKTEKKIQTRELQKRFLFSNKTKKKRKEISILTRKKIVNQLPEKNFKSEAKKRFSKSSAQWKASKPLGY